MDLLPRFWWQPARMSRWFLMIRLMQFVHGGSSGVLRTSYRAAHPLLEVLVCLCGVDRTSGAGCTRDVKKVTRYHHGHVSDPSSCYLQLMKNHCTTGPAGFLEVLLAHMSIADEVTADPTSFSQACNDPKRLHAN